MFLNLLPMSYYSHCTVGFTSSRKGLATPKAMESPVYTCREKECHPLKPQSYFSLCETGNGNILTTVKIQFKNILKKFNTELSFINYFTNI